MKSELRKAVGSAQPITWGVPVAIFMALAIMLGVQILFSIVLYGVAWIAGWDAAKADRYFSSSMGTLLSTMIIELATIFLVVWFVRAKGASTRILVGIGSVRWRDLLYTIGGFITYIILLVTVYSAVIVPLGLDKGGEQSIGFDNGINSNNLPFAVLSLVIFPPIAEEIVFRGFLYGSLRARKVRVWVAMIITSLLFGALHLFTGRTSILWVAAIDTFVLSMVLCYVRERTNSIVPTIIIHALKNSLALISLFLKGL